MGTLRLSEVSQFQNAENIFASKKNNEDIVDGFIPPVFDKSEEEYEKLKAIFLENFLTNQLSEQELDTLILALGRRNYKAEDVIIK